MSIAFHCSCGKSIRMPDLAAGKKARCKQCQQVFTVPSASAPAAAGSENNIAQPRPASAGKTSLPPVSKPPVAKPVPAKPAAHPLDMLYDLADAEPTSQPVKPPRSPAAEPPAVSARCMPPVQIEIEPDEDVDRTGGFARDLVRSFLFFTDAGSLVTWIVVTLVSMVQLLIGFGGLFALLGTIVIQGYLAAFYMDIIGETAGGKDDLPNPSVASIWDFFGSLVQFWGAKLLVWIPYLVVLGQMKIGTMAESPELLLVLRGAGMLFWPAVILMIAIGGGFRALWPPTLVVRTMLSAPLAYVVVAGVIVGVETASSFVGEQIANVTGPNATAAITSVVLLQVLFMYASIVSMRAVGLYYRHFKADFPWTAE